MSDTAGFWEKLGMPFGRELILEYRTQGDREWWEMKSKPEDDRPVPPFTIRQRENWFVLEYKFLIGQIIPSDHEGMDIKIISVDPDSRDMEAEIVTTTPHWEDNGLPQGRKVRLAFRRPGWRFREWWKFEPVQEDQPDSVPRLTLELSQGQPTFYYR